MNNYERIKTGLLIGLVCLSLVLTWQLWTYQPDIALLNESTRYIPNEAMSEEKKLTDVIWPEQIIIHHKEEYTAVLPDNHQFEPFYNKLLTTSLNKDEDTIKVLESLSGLVNYSGVELIYPTAIPIDVFLGLFQVDQKEVNLPIEAVDHIFVYVEPQDGQVHMRLISRVDEQVIDVKTSLPQKDFERTFLASSTDFEKMVKLDNDSSDSVFAEDVYIPENKVKAKRLSFTVSPISGEFFRQALFTDPDSVKYYRQSDNEESYTDGNRIINIRTNGLFMEYNNPVFSSDSRERGSKHIVHRSYEFINGHGGWTDDYFLTDWDSHEIRDIAEYRLHINHYPVISFDGIDQMVLRVSRSGNQMESYSRPLFYLDSQPIDAQEEVELPSGLEVIDRLKELEYFDMTRLQKVVIGYEMIMPSRSFITVEPNWFVLYDGRWQKVNFDEERGSEDGLE